MPVWTFYIGMGLLCLCGCGRDARLADKELPSNLTVRSVSHYGLTLDEKAGPKEVGFVLFRALREDFEAKDHEARQAAINVQYDITAMNEVMALHREGLPPAETIFSQVRYWTPTIAHYAAQLPTEWESAKDRLIATTPQPSKTAREGALECQVLYQLEDPADEPNARVVLFAALVQDRGFWRVRSVGFVPNRRVLATRNKESAGQVQAVPDKRESSGTPVTPE